MQRLHRVTATVAFAAAMTAAALGCAWADRRADEQAVREATARVLPPGFEQDVVQLPEVNLHVVTGGRGPVVILLHGFPEDWSAWRRVMPALASRFQVIAPDLRGLGGSTTTSDAFDAAAMAGDIAALMTARGIGEAYVVGHDIGGPVAYALARLHLARVRGLMLVEAPLEGMPSWASVRASPLMWHLGFHQTANLPEQLLAGREAIYVRHFLTMSAAGREPDEADVARYAAAYRAPDRLEALLQVYRQLPRQEAFNLAARQKTATPIVVVGGERVFGPLVEGFARDLAVWGWSSVEALVVPGAGHYIADEQPQALADLIAQRAGTGR